MAEAFKNFLDQIPKQIMDKTETHSNTNMIIFRPTSYIIGQKTYIEDYHFIMPTSDPPPLRIEQQVYHFTKGKLISVSAETWISCTKSPSTRPYISMMVKKDFFREISRECVGQEEVAFSRVNTPYSSHLVNLIDRFEEELIVFQNDSPLMLQSINVQIAIQLLRESGCQNEVRAKKLPLDQNYIKRAIEYMTVYYNAKITIGDICQEIHLSPYYFIRMFKDATGLSPHEFILSIRIGKAEELLKKGNSIQEVAKLCGFVNSAHFSNRFKRAIGMPPSEYKRNYFIM